MDHASGMHKKCEREHMKMAFDQTEKPEMNISLMRANLWFGLIWIIMAFDYIDRMAVNAVLPLIKNEFQFADSQLGLISSAVGLSISLLSLPAAVLVDRWSRRKMISIMVFLWSMATYATGQAAGYFSLVLARLGVGVGEAGYNPTSSALISAWYPKKMRGIMMGILFSGQPLGTAAGFVIAGFLAHHYGWRACFGILALPGVILAALSWFLPDYRAVKVKTASDHDSKSGVWDTIVYILKSPTLILVYLVCAATSWSVSSFATWGVTFFARVFEMNVKQASLTIGVATILGFLGAPFAGWLGDKFMKRSNKGRLISSAILAFIYLIMISISIQTALLTHNFYLSIAFWIIGTFFAIGIVPSMYATTQDLVAPFFRAMAAGVLPLFGHLLGAVPGPIITGAISDLIDLPYALQLMAVVSVAVIVLLLILATRFYDKDLNRVKKFGTYELRED